MECEDWKMEKTSAAAGRSLFDGKQQYKKGSMSIVGVDPVKLN